MFGKDPVAAKTYGDKATVDHAEAIRARSIDVALLISTLKSPILHKESLAYINVLSARDQYIASQIQAEVSHQRVDQLEVTGTEPGDLNQYLRTLVNLLGPPHP